MRPEPCPTCGVRPTQQLNAPWGDGVQKIPVAPWLCASCGALAIIHLGTGKLIATTEADWERVQRENPRLWAHIVQARALLRDEGSHDAAER